MRKHLAVRIITAILAIVAPVLCHSEANITRAEAYAALQSAFGGTPLHDLKFGPGQLIMPGTVVARNTGPNLRVLQAKVNRREGVIDARLGCEHYACLPFYVTIHADVGGAKLRDRSFSWTHRDPVHPDHALRTFAIKAGEPAQLTVEEDGLRISVRVVCLQPGSVGQVIRVRIVGTNRVANAYVKSSKQLLLAAVFARSRQ